MESTHLWSEFKEEVGKVVTLCLWNSMLVLGFEKVILFEYLFLMNSTERSSCNNCNQEKSKLIQGKRCR